MAQKPVLVKGTRDFLPEQTRKRKYIFKVIEDCFKAFGYQPIETPAMESLSTLMGKYGEEGDKLLFKVLNSGDYLKSVPDEEWDNKDSSKLTNHISEKGLRYDLTVPLARAVVMNRHLIHFPFKRYQIQPVWRADRPQRGRYREFYQCDADVVGSDSLMYEAELIMIYLEVFKNLGIPVKVTYNHRAILEGMAIYAGREDLFVGMTVVLDKLDKIGADAVIQELVDLGFEKQKAIELLELNKEKDLGKFELNEKATLGTKALNNILNYLEKLEFDRSSLSFEPNLARGLSYYTGTIFEVIPTSIQMGSLGGGGRYDNLTGVFGMPGVSGVGISFGADRIYDVMEELSLFPANLNNSIEVLLMALDEPSHLFAFQLASKLRLENISVELYPEFGKLKKQFKYAEDIKAVNTLVIGEEEALTGQFKLKNQATAVESILDLEGLIRHIKAK
ncbi:MAG: histidine--tRNA ligase [Saprospiraceae bacterium]